MESVFRTKRRNLIEEIKNIRRTRDSIKGVPGTETQWNACCKAIQERQKQVDQLSKMLGLPPKQNYSMTPAGTPNGVSHKAVKRALVRKNGKLSKEAVTELQNLNIEEMYPSTFNC